MENRIIELLKEYGLNTYEAEAYYRLLQLGEATAAEIVKFSNIPQQRIYDALQSLERKGFIGSLNTKPRRYRAYPVRKALLNRIRQLRLDFELKEEYLENLILQLEKLLPTQEETGGEVSLLYDKTQIAEKVISLLLEAQRDVKIVGVKPLFVLGCKDNLSKYLRKRVNLKVIGILERICKEEIKNFGGMYCEKKTDYTYLLIVDDIKLLVIFTNEKGLQTGLYAENEAIVKPFVIYFESIWEECKKEKNILKQGT